MAILNLNVAQRFAGPFRFSYAPLRRLVAVVAGSCCVLRSLIFLSLLHTQTASFSALTLGFSGVRRSVTVRYEELRLWLLLSLLLLEAAIGFVPAADISCGEFRWVVMVVVVARLLDSLPAALGCVWINKSVC